MRVLAPTLLLLALWVGPAAAHSGMDGVASPLLAPGESFRLVVDGAGTYQLSCHLHATMLGALEVAPGDGSMSMAMDGPTHRIDLLDAGPDGMGAFRDEATGTSTTTLTAGDVVEFVNTGNATHDVHLVRTSAANSDNGSFEAWVLGGLGVALVAIFLVSRRH